jgi:hypothetical protein
LPLGRGPRPSGEERQPLLQPQQQRRQREHLDTRGGQLDRQRQAVETPADLGDLAVRSEVRADGSRPLQEERYGFALSQRVDRDLPLSVDVERLAARDEHGEPRARTNRLGYLRGGIDQVLEVVEHQ